MENGADDPKNAPAKPTLGPSSGRAHPPLTRQCRSPGSALENPGRRSCRFVSQTQSSPDRPRPQNVVRSIVFKVNVPSLSGVAKMWSRYPATESSPTPITS